MAELNTATPVYAGGGIPAIRGVPPQLRAQREMLGWRLYDSVIIGTAAAGLSRQQYRFFWDVQNKTQYQTNMKTQGYLPREEKFEVRAIGMAIFPTMVNWMAITATATPAALVAAVNPFMTGWWKFQVGEKEYNSGTLHELLTLHTKYISKISAAVPAQAPPVLGAFIEQREAPFFKSAGVYGLDTPVTLDSGTSFYLEVNWNAVIATVAGQFRIYCYLIGRRERRAIG
jgi:hypothetical protein